MHVSKGTLCASLTFSIKSLDPMLRLSVLSCWHAGSTQPLGGPAEVAVSWVSLSASTLVVPSYGNQKVQLTFTSAPPTPPQDVFICTQSIGLLAIPCCFGSSQRCIFTGGGVHCVAQVLDCLLGRIRRS